MKIYTPKRLIILVAYLSLILIAVLPLFLDPKSNGFLLIELLALLVINFSFIFWVSADVRERGTELGKNWSYVFVFFGYLAIFPYLLRTRGFARGSLAIAGLLGVIAGGMFLAVIVSVIALIISGQHIK